MRRPLMDADDLRNYCSGECPDPILEEVTRIVLSGYSESAKLCSKLFRVEVGHDVRGDLARAFIENSLPRLGGMFPGVQTSIERHAGNNSNFVKVKIGSLFITVHRTNGFRDAIPVAISRQNLMRTCQKNYLREVGMEDAKSDVATDDALWVAVIHAVDKSPSLPAAPSFVRLVFPYGDQASHIFGFDLLKRFPWLSEKNAGEPVVAITEEPVLKLREGVRPARRESEQA